jgi:hypothetical protein
MTGYISVREASACWDITTRQVQKLCADGRIEGAVVFANTWAIPEDAVKPTRTVPVKPGPKPKRRTEE